MADKDRKLVRTVRVRDDEGVDHVFKPGDEVPSWAVEKIANPGAWGEGAGDDRPAIDAPLDPDEVAEQAEAERKEREQDEDDDEDDERDADGATTTTSRSSSSRSSSSSSRSPRAASRARSS